MASSFATRTLAGSPAARSVRLRTPRWRGAPGCFLCIVALCSGCGGTHSAKPLHLTETIVFQREGTRKVPVGACPSTCPEPPTYVVRPGNEEVKLGSSLTFSQRLRYFADWSRDRRRAVVQGCSGDCLETFDASTSARSKIAQCGKKVCFDAVLRTPSDVS